MLLLRESAFENCYHIGVPSFYSASCNSNRSQLDLGYGKPNNVSRCHLQNRRILVCVFRHNLSRLPVSSRTRMRIFHPACSPCSKYRRGRRWRLISNSSDSGSGFETISSIRPLIISMDSSRCFTSRNIPTRFLFLGECGPPWLGGATRALHACSYVVPPNHAREIRISLHPWTKARFAAPLARMPGVGGFPLHRHQTMDEIRRSMALGGPRARRPTKDAGVRRRTFPYFQGLWTGNPP